MALQGGMITQSGIILPNAYAKVIRVDYDYYMKSASIRVYIFKDQAARNANMQFVEAHEFRTNSPSEFDIYFGIDELDEKNVIKQAYLFLKKFPQFEGWQDI